jgi:hypothetical protein
MAVIPFRYLNGQVWLAFFHSVHCTKATTQTYTWQRAGYTTLLPYVDYNAALSMFRGPTSLRTPVVTQVLVDAGHYSPWSVSAVCCFGIKLYYAWGADMLTLLPFYFGICSENWNRTPTFWINAISVTKDYVLNTFKLLHVISAANFKSCSVEIWLG